MTKTDIRFYLCRYGHNLRTRREELGLSQLDVANILHCSQAIISHIETGSYLPSDDFEEKLFMVYDQATTKGEF